MANNSVYIEVIDGRLIIKEKFGEHPIHLDSYKRIDVDDLADVLDKYRRRKPVDVFKAADMELKALYDKANKNL